LIPTEPKDLVYYALALVGAACFAIVFRAPRRYFVPTTLLGAAAAIGIHVFPEQWHIGFASFVVALGVGCGSQVLARVSGAPAQCFLIPAVMFLVPGTWIYRAFTAAVESRLEDATVLGMTAVTITVGISFGILLANWVIPSSRTL
jgi:uncharacterized membrane protein YjjB (DUF3815 family)